MIRNVICILLLNTSILMAHPIKMSTGKLQYDAATGLIELTINFFIDDFEAQLQKQYRMANLKLTSDKALTRSFVEDYTSKKFSLKINSQLYHLQLNDVNILESNVLQAKYSVVLKPGVSIETLDICDQFLFEAYADQVNILHVNLPGLKEKIILKFLPFENCQTVKL